MSKIYSVLLFTFTMSLFFFSCTTTKEVEKLPPPAEKPVENSVEVMEEYSRSVGNLDVSIEDFTKDKKEILEIISKMDTIMTDKNYNEWVTYVDEESIRYWSNTTNLRKASNRLPTRGSLTLKTLEDYFNYVFISSRSGRKIDEIRYESSSSVKAVETREELELVYYNFKKVDGKWKINLPPI